MSKRILITGAKGFIGKTIHSYLLNNTYHIINAPGRDTLDVSNFKQLEKLISEFKPHFVINAAIKGGRLLKEYSAGEFHQNILMVENILYLQSIYGFNLINFGSGAKEDRNNDVINLKEGQFGPPPVNFYSLSKYFTAKRLLNQDKVVQLNIFNCFGIYESDDRFIKTAIKNYIDKKPIEIWGDKYFDFFYSEDLCKVVNYFINNPDPKYYELNLVYPEKKKLSEIVDIVNNMSYYRTGVIIKDGINRHYNGNGSRLETLQLDLVGLENGIGEVYRYLKNE